MSKEKGPPGYPGDEAIRKKFGELMRALRLEKGLSPEQVDAFVDEAMQEDIQPLLSRAFSLVTRKLREGKKMSRVELSAVSGLTLRLINRLERPKGHNLTLTQVVRIAMALDHDIGAFVDQVLKVEEQLKAK